MRSSDRQRSLVPSRRHFDPCQQRRVHFEMEPEPELAVYIPKKPISAPNWKWLLRHDWNRFCYTVIPGTENNKMYEIREVYSKHSAFADFNPGPSTFWNFNWSDDPAYTFGPVFRNVVINLEMFDSSLSLEIPPKDDVFNGMRTFSPIPEPVQPAPIVPLMNVALPPPRAFSPLLTKAIAKHHLNFENLTPEECLVIQLDFEQFIEYKNQSFRIAFDQFKSSIYSPLDANMMDFNCHVPPPPLQSTYPHFQYKQMARF